MKKSSLVHLVATALAAWTSLSVGNASAQEVENFTITSNGKAMFDVFILGTNFQIDDDSWLDQNTSLTPSSFELNDALKSGIVDGLTYWADILAPQSTNPSGLPIIIVLNGAGGTFAGPYSTSLSVNDWLQKGIGTTINSVESLKKAGEIASGESFDNPVFGTITIGDSTGSTDYPNAGRGWSVDSGSVLPSNETTSDLVATMRHEAAHILGFISNSHYLNTNGEGVLFPHAENSAYRLCAFGDIDGTNTFSDHLYDYTGTKAKNDMPIVSEAMYEQFSNNKTLTMDKSAVFLLEFNDSDNVAARYAYFKGEHVSEVLNGATYYGIDGLPVNGWEYLYTQASDEKYVYYPELSHLSTTVLVTHGYTRNATTLQEVELAVMQDIGYQFDRKNYYGWSEYRNGQHYDNWQGYSKRNESGTSWITGTPNTTPLAIGLDIQGESNTIRQRADILTIGNGSVGIRVDGSKNSLTVADDASVHADGRLGVGILVSDGIDQHLAVDGTVTATGDGGKALQLDYGYNWIGPSYAYIGSYIYYERSVGSSGNIVAPCNVIDGYCTYSDGVYHDYENPALVFEQLGPLLTSVDLSGTVIGQTNAVYISKNAFVREINFLGNARVTGDIASEWKRFDPAIYPYLLLNYNGQQIDAALYVPELVTTFRFAGDNVRVDGNISALDNSRIVFASGTASINGNVATTSVDIAEGAIAKGNAQYQLISKTALTPAAGYSVEENVGRFTNAGTLAPGNSIGSITIDGDYVQTPTGTLEIEVDSNGSTDTLTVNNGTASVAGSLVLKPLAGGYYKMPQIVHLADILKTSDYANVTPTVTANPFTSPTLTMSLTEQGEGAEATYTLSYERDYATWATNRNESAVAGALENASSVSEPMQSLFSAIDFSSLDGSDVRRALQVLQPGLQADTARSLIASRQNFVNWRHDALLKASLAGDGHRIYAVPFGQHESRHSGNDRWRADEAGVFAGMESVTSGNVISWHGSLAKKSLKSGQDRGQADAVSIAVSADGLWKPRNNLWNLSTGVSAAYDAVHAKRRASFAGLSYRNDDHYAVWSAGAFAGTGLEIPIASVTLTPYARLNYNVLQQGKVKESGDSTALCIDKATLQSLSSNLGLRTTATATADDGTKAAFVASLAWNHEFLSRFGRFHTAFRNAENASFTTNVEPLAHESVEAMASMKLEKDNFAFGALLGGEVFSGTGAEGFLQLHLSWNF